MIVVKYINFKQDYKNIYQNAKKYKIKNNDTVSEKLQEKIDMIIKTQEDVNKKINMHLSQPKTIYNNCNNKKDDYKCFFK